MSWIDSLWDRRRSTPCPAVGSVVLRLVHSVLPRGHSALSSTNAETSLDSFPLTALSNLRFSTSERLLNLVDGSCSEPGLRPSITDCYRRRAQTSRPCQHAFQDVDGGVELLFRDTERGREADDVACLQVKAQAHGGCRRYISWSSYLRDRSIRSFGRGAGTCFQDGCQAAFVSSELNTAGIEIMGLALTSGA